MHFMVIFPSFQNFSQLLKGSCFLSACTIASSTKDLPQLSASDLATLTICRSFVDLPKHATGEVDTYIIRNAFYQDSGKILDSVKLRATVIRDTLYDKLLERNDTLVESKIELSSIHRPHISSKACKILKRSEVEKLGPIKVEDGEDASKPSVQVIDVIDKAAYLKHPTALFACQCCQSVLDWQSLMAHPCISNDLGHATYGSHRSGYAVETRCKPVGFQADRVLAPPEYPIASSKLKAAVKLFVTGREWKYTEWHFPKTHAQATESSYKRWFFSCDPDKCADWSCRYRNRHGRKNFREMVNGHYRSLSLKLVRSCATRSEANQLLFFPTSSSCR